jgi:hypothetical protein
MKNQNDLIISIVCGVLAIGGITTLYFTKRDPQTPSAVTKANVTTPVIPAGSTKMTNGLAGGGAAAGGGGGFAGFGGGAPGAARPGVSVGGGSGATRPGVSVGGSK